MHYSINPAKVRVDIFKDSGEWYDTIEILWEHYKAPEGKTLHELLRKYIKDQMENRYQGMWAVCLEPYSDIAYPIMIKIK